MDKTKPLTKQLNMQDSHHQNEHAKKLLMRDKKI